MSKDFKKSLSRELAGVRLNPVLRGKLIDIANGGGNKVRLRHKTYAWLAVAAALALALGAIAFSTGVFRGDINDATIIAQAPTATPAHNNETTTPFPTYNNATPTPFPAYDDETTPEPTAAPGFELPKTTAEPTPPGVENSVAHASIYNSCTLNIISDGLEYSVYVHAQYLGGGLSIYYETTGETYAIIDVSEFPESVHDEDEYIIGYPGAPFPSVAPEETCAKACAISVSVCDTSERVGALSGALMYDNPPIKVSVITRYALFIEGQWRYVDCEPERVSLNLGGEIGNKGEKIPYFTLRLSPAGEPPLREYADSRGKRVSAAIGEVLTLVIADEDWEDLIDLSRTYQDGRYLVKTVDILKNGALVIGNSEYK